MTTFKAKFQRLEGHRLDTLSKVMALSGENIEEVTEKFSDEGENIIRWGKDIESDEEVEAKTVENQEFHKDTPSDEA